MAVKPTRPAMPTDGSELLEPLDADELEAWAEANLPRMVFDYVAGGAGAEVTLADNREAFARFKLLPRHLRDVTVVDGTATILGVALRAPMVVAPMALQGLVHADAEAGMARAAGDAGLAMVFSTASSQSIEEVSPPACPLWFQLYMQRDPGITRDLVDRAVAAGAIALCLTVDMPIPGARRRDLANQFRLPAGVGYANLAPYAVRDDASNLYGAALDQSATWDDVEWLRSVSGLPVMVKGVLTPDDARHALASGAAAVGVSNHGGRQLDMTPASLDVLAEIVDAVAGEGAVVFDSGVRRAIDVAVAMCLGADAVMIGRPALWALAYGGYGGARRFLSDLVEDFIRTLTLVGARRIEELGPSLLRARDQRLR